MSKWNYAAVYDPDKELYYIGEIYPTEDGYGYTGPISPNGDSKEELLQDLTNMRDDALHFPVFNLKTEEYDD